MSLWAAVLVLLSGCTPPMPSTSTRPAPTIADAKRQTLAVLHRLEDLVPPDLVTARIETARLRTLLSCSSANPEQFSWPGSVELSTNSRPSALSAISAMDREVAEWDGWREADTGEPISRDSTAASPSASAATVIAWYSPDDVYAIVRIITIDGTPTIDISAYSPCASVPDYQPYQQY